MIDHTWWAIFPSQHRCLMNVQRICVTNGCMSGIVSSKTFSFGLTRCMARAWMRCSSTMLQNARTHWDAPCPTANQSICTSLCTDLSMILSLSGWVRLVCGIMPTNHNMCNKMNNRMLCSWCHISYIE